MAEAPEVVERVHLDELTRGDETHVNVADASTVLRLVEQAVPPVDDRLLEDATPIYQEKNLQIKGEVERVYQSMSSVLIRDLDRFRSVFVDKAGSRSTVIWNPWKENMLLIKQTLILFRKFR